MKGITRRNFISGSSAGLVAGMVSSGDPNTDAQTIQLEHNSSQHSITKPNLVLFMPDELRADALACYGNPLVKTPNFDHLATQGTRFEQCHVAYPICGASRCALLTGWPTSVRGHRSQQYYLRPEEPNLFRYLRQAGYDVFWFGKNDALAAETFHDSVTAWNYIDGEPIVPTKGGQRGTEKAADVLPFLSATSSGDRRADLDYLRLRSGIKILERTQTERPFCLFLPLLSPHPPYNAPDGFNGMYSPADITGLLPADLPRRPLYMERMRSAYGMSNCTETDLRKIRAAYLGKVSYSDWLLGELMEALDRTNHTRDTALLVLSDHGDYAGDYGLVEKWPSGMEDCMTHVPLLARIPGGASRHVVSEQTELFDVMATCLDLASIETRHTHFARSLVRQLHGALGDPQRASFTEGGYNIYEPQCFEPIPAKGAEYYPRLHLHRSEPQTVSRCASVKTSSYHFVSRPQGQSELYILKSDPLQQNNRYGEKSIHEVQMEAEQRLLHWYVNTTGISPQSADSRDFPPYIPLTKVPALQSAEEILDQ